MVSDPDPQWVGHDYVAKCVRFSQYIALYERCQKYNAHFSLFNACRQGGIQLSDRILDQQWCIGSLDRDGI